MIALAGKRVLLVVPCFFGYERDIKEELVRQGATVDWLPDRPFDTPAMTALTKLRPKWVLPAADRLYERLLQEFGATHYDLVLVVNGQTLSSHMLRRLRGAFPVAQFVLYLWDSIANRSHVRANLTLFDRIYTFDPDDAARYQLRLRPLFYGHGFNATKPMEAPAHYQISFIGTAHTDRFAVVDRLRTGLHEGVNAFWYLYLQAPWVMHFYRLTKPNMRHSRLEDFNFSPLEKKIVQSVFTESHSILDIEHPRQVGLTMRTFETLGANKKLVTTNAGVREYDFFSAENICVIDRASPRIPPKFFDTPFMPLSDKIRHRYSITGWLAELLEE
jgi:hypothetical protein